MRQARVDLTSTLSAADTWSVDYQHRDSSVARFLEHIDCNAIAKRYGAVDRR